MTREERQEVLHKGGIAASPASAGTTVNPRNGATVSSDGAVLVRKYVLDLTGVVITVLAANNYGGKLICEQPNSNLLMLSIEADLVLLKGGVANGLEAAVDLDVGVGTSVVNSQTLSNNDINLLEKKDLDANVLAAVYQAHSSGQSTATMPKELQDSSEEGWHLNIGVPAGLTANDTVTCSGTITFYYIDVGKKT